MLSPSVLQSERCQTLGKSHIKISPTFLFFVTAPPIFLVEPSDQKVAEGAPASLDCIAAGNPTPTLFWIKESSPGIYLPATTHGHVTVTPEGTLRIGKRA